LTRRYNSTIQPGLQAVCVRGNYLAASTTGAVAAISLSDVTGIESCVFTENQCLLLETDAGRKAPARNVALSAPAVIAGNNVINNGG
jgi:hypothetical protein